MRWSRIVAVLFAAACGGMSDSSLDGLPAGTTVLDSHAGATNISTTIRAGQFVAWRSSDGMHHTVTSLSAPAAFVDVDVPAGGVSTARSEEHTSELQSRQY